jgi:hypothetical protein
MTKEEVADHIANIEDWRSRGEVIGKKRKPCNNKGTKRKRRTKDVDADMARDEGGTQPSGSSQRRVRVSQSTLPKSKPFVSDEESDSDSSV